MKEILNNIIKIRKKYNWTQSELSIHSGLTKAIISKIENGHREISMKILCKIANAFNIPIADLFKSESFREHKFLINKYDKLSEKDKLFVMELIDRLIQ